MRFALDRYPSIAARRQEYAAAQGVLDGARWQRYPSVSVSGAALGSNGAAPSTISVQQALWAGGRIDAGIAAADARRVAASSGTLVEEQNVLERTVAAYVELQRQQARLLASQDNVRRHEELYGLIARRVGQEVSSAADSALAMARLAQARAERQQILAASGNARAALQSLSGEAVRAVVAQDAPTLGFDSLQEAMTAAENFSPEIARQRSLANACCFPAWRRGSNTFAIQSSVFIPVQIEPCSHLNFSPGRACQPCLRFKRRRRVGWGLLLRWKGVVLISNRNSIRPGLMPSQAPASASLFGCLRAQTWRLWTRSCANTGLDAKIGLMCSMLNVRRFRHDIHLPISTHRPCRAPCGFAS
jgi:hypothetical protein